MLLGEEFGVEILLLRRADNEDRASVGDCFGDIFEERLVLLNPVPCALLRGMDVANNVVADYCPVRFVDIEVENARPPYGRSVGRREMMGQRASAVIAEQTSTRQPIAPGWAAL